MILLSVPLGWAYYKMALMRRQAQLTHEQLANLNFFQLCKDTLVDFHRTRNGGRIVYSVYKSMWRVVAEGQVV